MMGDTSLLLMIVMPFVGSIIAGLLPANARNAEVWLSGAVALGELMLASAAYPAIAAVGAIRTELE